MTNREFYQSVIDGKITDETLTKATELLQKLDASNEKRKSADSKEKQETAARRETVLKFLQDNPGEFTRDAIAEQTGLTPGQVSSACKSLGESVKKSETKIDKARRIVYSLA